MNIEQAQNLKFGSTVHCPEDRGDKPYFGKVISKGDSVCTASNGTEYLWVTVRHPVRWTESVWPSNRLGKV